MNCQTQRAQRGPDPIALPVVKPQPSLSNISTPASELKDRPTGKVKSTESSVVKKEVIEASLPKKEAPKTKTAVPTDMPQKVYMGNTQLLSATAQGPGNGVSDQQQPAGKEPQVQPSQITNQEVMAGVSKQEEAGKPAQQPTKSVISAAKSAQPSAQAAKQESGSFFGFGGPKTKSAKSAESMTGKMFGFGTSIFSSASTLITSAVQDEPKTTPPTPRKMSMSSHVPAQTTSPVSPKMSQAKETKPPAQKAETPPETKAVSSEQDEEKTQPESPKVAPKEKLSTCPLCKVELNMGSKDSPNYNTCTECKNFVCSLCGFNPMPHTGGVSAIGHFLKTISTYDPF